MFYLILKPNARIPSYDTFVARRIGGPGLASNHFYQVYLNKKMRFEILFRFKLLNLR